MTPNQATDSTKPETAEDLCKGCGGSGTIMCSTSHLGPDDYDFEADCEACYGTGSSDIRDAIKALSYQPHTVKTGLQMVDRAAVLRIFDARAALLAADGKPGGEVVALQVNGVPLFKNPPADVVDAAFHVSDWAHRNNYTNWRIGHCCSEDYTRPQQAAQVVQPLTEEEIEKWWESENGLEDMSMSKWADFRNTIRAVERKLGIGKD